LKLFTKDKLKHLDAEPEMMGAHYLVEVDSDFTVTIQENPMKMKNNSPSCDEIPAETWKKFSKNKKGMGILMDKFNKTLEVKTYCNAWTKATVCAVHKNKGKVGETKNYRVSLLSVEGKFFPSILATRMGGCLVNSKTLLRFQVGLVKKLEDDHRQHFCNQTITDRYLRHKTECI
jgi:hypothetical protein